MWWLQNYQPPHQSVLDTDINPRVKDVQRLRIGKHRRGLQIFDTRVGFPFTVQSGGRIYKSIIYKLWLSYGLYTRVTL